jgi:hypothetical protein
MFRSSKGITPLGSLVGALLCVLLLVNGCGGSGGGAGTGGSAAFFPAFTIYWSVVVGDLNGDGKRDIAVSATFTASGLSPSSGFVGVYLQDPAKPGTFLPPVKYSVGASPVFLAVSDLNGDGKPDLVAVNSTAPGGASDPLANQVSVLLQDPAKPGQFLPAVSYATGSVPSSVAIGDLNGDGKPDLAVTDSGGLSVLLQSSSVPGTFVAAMPIALSSTPSSVAIADLNGDQKPDLAVTTATDVLVLLQSSSVPGTFSNPTSYGAGLQPTSVAVADLNGDGKPDLAVANEGDPMTGNSPSVSVLIQNPAVPGTFLAATNFPTDRHSSYVVVTDLNGDGKPDLAVANITSVSVLLQDPNVPGNFKAATNYPCKAQVSSAAIADMNGDQKPDLVITDGDGIVIRLQDSATPGAFLAQTVIAN